jgi:hypothetical protein
MATTYTRPTDWLAMPARGSQEFIGLLAITEDDSNHIALLCAGNYTVDWGDGVIENFASGVKANHSYTYSSIGGETISTRGYKQVLVRVTPQAGQNLTTLNLQQQNSILAKMHVTGWLDIAINGANITTLSLGGLTVKQGMCEIVTIGSIGSIASFSNLFNSFYSLQSISLFNTAAGTNFNNMFTNCYNLGTIPLFVTSLGTNFSSMFIDCRSLKSIPLLDTGKATNIGNMFANCRLLKTIPLLNTALVTDFSQMVMGCNSLKTFPLINMASATNLSTMFADCYSIQSIPLLNTASVTNFWNMFANCQGLTKIPTLNTASGTNFERMFLYCSQIQSIPNLNAALGTNFTNILAGCISVAKGNLQGTRYSISYTNLCLGRNAIVDIFNGLGTAVGTPTITITTNPGFNAKPLNAVAGNWRGITVQSSTQDVYASNGTTLQIYKQTGGVGPFVVESTPFQNFKGMGTDIYGNIYCATSLTANIYKRDAVTNSWTALPTVTPAVSQCVTGDFLGNLYVGTFGSGGGLHKQTAMTGSFVQVFTGNVGSLAISPIDGSIYVTDIGATGTIYKQTAGIGSFVAVQNISYSSVWCSASGDVYACNGATLYKQTAGTGSFVSMGITNLGNYAGVEKSDGTLYTINTDIYLTDFTKVVMPTDRLIATSKGWTIA